MITSIDFPTGSLPSTSVALRRDVRKFLSDELHNFSVVERSKSWDFSSPSFSQKMAANGWLGMTLPTEYGGRGMTSLERYVVSEELLFAGAPVGFHWIADRQSGPLIARVGTDQQKEKYLPHICRGEVCFAIGMSEPNAGSDLAAVRTRAERCRQGWKVNGTKVWTTNAHIADFMIALFRTDRSENRHGGLSQFVVDLKNTPGVSIQPITDLSGRRHFNEVVFEDAILSTDSLLGKEGAGWKQVNAELALERSGPERYMSTMVLFSQLLDYEMIGQCPIAQRQIGTLVAQLLALRQMSLSVAHMLAVGEDASLQAAMVKSVGTSFEQQMPAIVQDLLGLQPSCDDDNHPLLQVLANLTLLAPSFSLRGGTTEILKGIIAKELRSQ